jgi:ribonuclease P protein component
MHEAGLSKKERIVSRTQIDTLFQAGNSSSLAAYPVRLVYRIQKRTEDDEPAMIMVSVSKRHFKRAVKRNRVKRQLREAYRLSKQQLLVTLQQHSDLQVEMVFLWQSDELYPSSVVHEKMQNMLNRLIERLK